MSNRNGMTILEVLFAIMIVAVGLLGAIAVFPVASEAAKRGRINDMVTVSSDAVSHKFDAMHMRRPDHWIAFVDGTATNQQAIQVPGETVTASPVFWKTSFCIDPRFTAQNIGAHAQTEQNWTYFPAYPKASPLSPRMQRLTLKGTTALINGYIYPVGLNSPPMGKFHADLAFGIEDELAYERPGVQSIGDGSGTSNADPAFQLYSPIKTAGGTLPGKREDHGKLSWMATLCPKMDRFGGSLGTEYVLSVVTFYERSPRLITRDFTVPQTLPDNEWTVSIAGADFDSQGFGGGEVRMHSATEAKLDLKSGQWVMLAGNVGAKPIQTGTDPQGNPIYTPTELAQVYRWYRVSDVDDLDTATINGTQFYVRYVTLVGADWDMQDVLPFNGASAPPSSGDGVLDDVEVTVMPSVVNVAERTVRLEL